jgi:hypothetical protein
VLYESLTVRETLRYAARLRLTRTMATADKLARAEDVIVALGLTRAADTIIGGYFRRGVSGGRQEGPGAGQGPAMVQAVLWNRMERWQEDEPAPVPCI